MPIDMLRAVSSMLPTLHLDLCAYWNHVPRHMRRGKLNSTRNTLFAPHTVF